jgi:hypothetical protein
MIGEIVKAELIINRNFYRSPLGPVVRLITGDRGEWWVYPGRDGLFEISSQGVLSEQAFRDELETALSGDK